MHLHSRNTTKNPPPPLITDKYDSRMHQDTSEQRKEEDIVKQQGPID